MEDIVQLLRTLDASELPDKNTEDYYLTTIDHPVVSEIEAIASDLLVFETGHPNFEMIDGLYRDYGYFIFPGERDSFGWLTGCLQTKKGIIVFG